MWKTTPTSPKNPRSLGRKSPSTSRSQTPSSSYSDDELVGGGDGEQTTLQIGDRVIISGTRGNGKIGILRYIGALNFTKGVWAGVELFYPQGKNNGTVEGVEYFRCQLPYGVFVPLRKISSSPVNGIIAKQIGLAANHKCGPGSNCKIHNKIYWNTMAVMSNN